MSAVTRINWNKVIGDIISLSDKIGHVDAILQISRGGCIPGSLLAYHKDIKNVFTISVKSYNDRNQQHELIMQQIPIELFGNEYVNKRILVVDDLADSGTTLRAIDNLFLERDMHVDFCTLYTKKNTSFKPQYSMDEYESDVWLEFPWDNLKESIS